MGKEIILVIAVVVSLVLIFLSLSRLNRLYLPKTTKTALIYLTLLAPVLGFILVFRIRDVVKSNV